MKIEKGKRYRVIEDNSDFFNIGDILVALEDYTVSFCVRETDYVEGKSINDYDLDECSAMCDYELEEIESEEE